MYETVNADPSSSSALSRPIEALDGVGPARAEAFHALGVKTLGDLLEYFPRDYQFESSELSIHELKPDQIQTARGEIVAVDYMSGGRRARFEATISDGTDKLALVWFNAAYLRQKLHPGTFIRVQGKVRYYRNMPQMANPKWEVVEETAERIYDSKFRSIYPASGRLPTEVIERTVAANLEAALGQVEEWFDEAVLRTRKLLGRRDAYRLIHLPGNLTDAMRARRRIIYDELMLMQLGLQLSKRLREGRLTAPLMRLDRLLDERIRKRFPFELTAAQQNAIYEIVRNLQSGQPMNRLLQGDVGSGKTVVALYAMLVGVANKLQSGPACADRGAGRAALPHALAPARGVERDGRAVHGAD
jgi:ATP-dependent DNA helicase RecG